VPARRDRDGRGRPEVEEEHPLILDHGMHAVRGQGELGDLDGSSFTVRKTPRPLLLGDGARRVAVGRVGPVDPPASGGVVAVVVEHDRAVPGARVEPGEQQGAVLGDLLGDVLDVADAERRRRQLLARVLPDQGRHSPRCQQDQRDHQRPAEHGHDRPGQRRAQAGGGESLGELHDHGAIVLVGWLRSTGAT
jgi:hypothetical protein